MLCALRDIDINILVPTIAVLFGVQLVLVPNLRVSRESRHAEKSPREARGHKLASQCIFNVYSWRVAVNFMWVFLLANKGYCSIFRMRGSDCRQSQTPPHPPWQVRPAPCTKHVANAPMVLTENVKLKCQRVFMRGLSVPQTGWFMRPAGGVATVHAGFSRESRGLIGNWRMRHVEGQAPPAPPIIHAICHMSTLRAFVALWCALSLQRRSYCDGSTGSASGQTGKSFARQGSKDECALGAFFTTSITASIRSCKRILSIGSTGSARHSTASPMLLTWFVPWPARAVSSSAARTIDRCIVGASMLYRYTPRLPYSIKVREVSAALATNKSVSR